MTHALSFVKGNAENPENYDSVDEIPVPVYEGHVCIGWSLEQGGSVAYTMENVKDAAEGTRLYFVWTEKAEEPSTDTETEQETAGN